MDRKELKVKFIAFLKVNGEFDNFQKYYKFNTYFPQIKSEDEYFNKIEPFQWITFAFCWNRAPSNKEDKKWKQLDTQWRKALKEDSESTKTT